MTAGYDYAAIKAANPIMPFLQSRRVRLRKYNGYYVGKCPLHHERKGEAFAVWPDEGRWECFGKCAAFGDITDLVAKWDGITIAEAAKRLEASIPGGGIRVENTPVKKVEKADPLPYELTKADRERMYRRPSEPAPCFVLPLTQRCFCS